MGSDCLMVTDFLFGGENILETDSGNGCKIVLINATEL